MQKGNKGNKGNKEKEAKGLNVNPIVSLFIQ
jgi:hypothetical protein